MKWRPISLKHHRAQPAQFPKYLFTVRRCTLRKRLEIGSTDDGTRLRDRRSILTDLYNCTIVQTCKHFQPYWCL